MTVVEIWSEERTCNTSLEFGFLSGCDGVGCFVVLTREKGVGKVVDCRVIEGGSGGCGGGVGFESHV